jgi:hypothetical protein
LVSRKKKSKAIKFVHFASPIRQKSPTIKSSPVLDSFSLKLGHFRCPISRPSIDYHKPCLTQDSSCISVLRVFSSIKNNLPRTGKENSISNSNSGYSSSLGFSKVAAPSSSRVGLACPAALPNRVGRLGKEPVHAPSMQDHGPRIDPGKATRVHEENLEKDLQFTSFVASRNLGCFQCPALGHWARSYRSKVRCRY